MFGENRSAKTRLPPLFAIGPRVAANWLRGLGAPETVTVGTEGLGLGFDTDEELVIVNREEMA